MSTGVVTVPEDATVEDVISAMEEHQIRRVPVVDDGGCCAGIISQSDIAAVAPAPMAGELLWEISRDTGHPSR
jgi:CBS-domain-containing membrane protein